MSLNKVSKILLRYEKINNEEGMMVWTFDQEEFENWKEIVKFCIEIENLKYPLFTTEEEIYTDLDEIKNDKKYYKILSLTNLDKEELENIFSMMKIKCPIM